MNTATDATVAQTTHATAHNNLSDSVIAIETELGVNPSGTAYATVAAAISDMTQKTPGANQYITPSGDYIGLAVRASTSQNVSNLMEVQTNTGTTLGYWDRTGGLSAASFKVSGTALAATHLSNGTTGTGAVVLAASPALTGSPTAPTQAAGDNSTKIATTAFVAANGVPAGVTFAFAGSTVPSGYLLADGSPVLRSTYANLFAAIGTIHGAGDGSTTFNLPDMQGRMVVGKGTNANVSTLGANDGLAVASRTMKHYHGVGTLAISTSVSAHSITDTGHTHPISNFAGGSGGSVQSGGAGGGSGNTGNATTGISIANHTATSTPSGNVGTTSGVAETPAYIVLNYIIKY